MNHKLAPLFGGAIKNHYTFALARQALEWGNNKIALIMLKSKKKRTAQGNKQHRERLKIKFSLFEIEIDQITEMAIIFLILVLSFFVILFKF